MPLYPPQTEGPYVKDLVDFEVYERFTRTSGTLENPSGVTAIADLSLLGQPVKDVAGQWTLVEAADIANAEGIVLSTDSIDLAASGITTEEYVILTDGPAVVVQDYLPAADCLAAAITLASFVAALDGRGIKSVAKSTVINKQTLAS